MTGQRLAAAQRALALFALALTGVVIVLGAYTRLSDAGLGCPDWPGCYGHLTVPEDPARQAAASAAFPERPLDPTKAWIEMIHRYFAGGLGLVILALTAIAWARHRRSGEGRPGQATGLAALVIFQGLLGMWTVTLLLKPVVVMGHLLGGFATLSLLWWLVLRERAPGWQAPPGEAAALRPWALLALVVVVGQIALGGWTSANYAALACVDFPTCHGRWWPAMDFGEAFVLWRGTGVDYEFGVLDSPARTAIHVTHRLGALVTVLVVGGLALRLLRARGGALRGTGAALLGLLAAQVSLGIGNVLLSLPLPVAVAHNAVGALLLLGVVALNHAVHPARQPAPVPVRGALT